MRAKYSVGILVRVRNFKIKLTSTQKMQQVYVWSRCVSDARRLNLAPITQTQQLCQHSVEYAVIALNDALCREFKLSGTAYSRLDYVCIPNDWIMSVEEIHHHNSISSSSSSSSSKSITHFFSIPNPKVEEATTTSAQPCLRSNLYEVLIGDIVRIYDKSSSFVVVHGAHGQHYDIRRSLSSIKLDQLRVDAFVPIPKYLQEKVVAYGLVAKHNPTLKNPAAFRA